MGEYVVSFYCADKGVKCEPVVRCKDCKSTAPYGDGIECLGPLVQTWDYYNDEPLHNPVPPEGFCSWGVPKEVPE